MCEEVPCGMYGAKPSENEDPEVELLCLLLLTTVPVLTVSHRHRPDLSFFPVLWREDESNTFFSTGESTEGSIQGSPNGNEEHRSIDFDRRLPSQGTSLQNVSFCSKAQASGAPVMASYTVEGRRISVVNVGDKIINTRWKKSFSNSGK